MAENFFIPETTQPAATPIQRLFEARWFLAALALIFLFFSLEWPEGEVTFLVCYFILAGVVAFSPRRENRVVADPAPKSARPIWPQTQAKLFVNAIPEPSIVLDGDGIVRHSNAPMRDVFGSLPQGEALSLKFRDPAMIDALHEVQKTGQIVSMQHIVRFPMERRYLVYFSPITMPRTPQEKIASQEAKAAGKLEKPDFIFVVMLDDTERYRLNELRSDFIANVSHELRTPVASLMGFIETLLGPARNDAEGREKFLKIMLEQAQRMSRLVDDLLSLNRIEMRSHMRPTASADVVQVARHVADALQPLANSASVTLDLDLSAEPLLVTGDEDELIQVMQNLVENACKYGSDGGKVKITAALSSAPPEVGSDQGRWCVLSVQDFGKGIDPAHLPRLTERFYRIDTAESKAKMGTGLGLAVVKHILARHGAEFRIKSAPGEGSLFSVYLRLQDA